MKVDKKILFVGGMVVVLILGILFFKNFRTGGDVNNNFNGEVKEFNVVAKQWEFEPAVIDVNKGDKVILNIKSIDVVHGITLTDFGINKRLKPGETVNIEFIADKTGEFDFFCNVYCENNHRDMKRKLIVN